MADLANTNQGDLDKFGPGPAPVPTERRGYPDLHDNGDNPFSAGAPPIAMEQPSAFPQGGPPQYYVPIPDPDVDNPYTQGIAAPQDASLSRTIAGGLDAAYAGALDSSRLADGPAPTSDDYARDKGVDDQLIPPGRRV